MPEPTEQNEYESWGYPAGINPERSEGTETDAEEALRESLLEHFTVQQITNLYRVRQAVVEGNISESTAEATAESRRLLFARWLVAHGRLDG